MEPLQIESIAFSNFKALVNTTLPLGRFTLIVGPNGSGKSTALQGIAAVGSGAAYGRDFIRFRTAASGTDSSAPPEIVVAWNSNREIKTRLTWSATANTRAQNSVRVGTLTEIENPTAEFLSRIRIFSLNPSVMSNQVQLSPQSELDAAGANLASVVDRLRDESPERFELLNDELRRWLPEFDRVLFETPQAGFRAIRLRTSNGGYSIPASELSQGTLLALAMLTLAYMPNPPSLVGLEEPDRGIHPRLLRDVRDALYRLAYPEDFGESRPPVQVVATTQSPYFLNLFREHLEEIVIAETTGLEAKFVPLAQHDHIEEILADAPLGDVWYSGVLGGVPSHP
jgi:predicted ATPase